MHRKVSFAAECESIIILDDGVMRPFNDASPDFLELLDGDLNWYCPADSSTACTDD